MYGYVKVINSTKQDLLMYFGLNFNKYGWISAYVDYHDKICLSLFFSVIHSK